MQLMVWVGPHSPEWIYSAGVPLVRTSETLNPRGQTHFTRFPFYLDENYKLYYHRMIREVAKHVDLLPAGVRRKIIVIQTAEGSTGDEGGYKGRPLDKRYELPEDRWNAFKFETWKLFDSLYRNQQPPIHILANSGNRGEYDEWLRQNMPNWWRKAGNPGHGYQLNNEKDMMTFFDPLINHPESGTLVRARSEMDETFKGWFQDAPVWNAYWLNLWALHFGLDIFVNGADAVTNPAYREGFEFFRDYAGEKDAATSPGAWCALRDGLDAGDRARFPDDKFGTGQFRSGDPAEGLQRSLNIAKAFERFGALQGDPEKAMALVMQNRSAKRMNDVGWNIEAGDYRRYMEQYDPNGTSQGYWRVGSKDQPYGRFARGFDTASGRNAMYLMWPIVSSAASRWPERIRCACAWCISMAATGRGRCATMRWTNRKRWRSRCITAIPAVGKKP
jgi:hypothetical protein